MNRFKQHLDRRSLLRALGASAAVAPFLPAHLASAQAPAPKRLILYFSANGLFFPEWAPDVSSADFALRAILKPLEPFRRKMVVFRNLDWQSYFAYPIENSHDPAAHTFTGAEARRLTEGQQHHAQGPSVDQYLAQKLGRAGSFDGTCVGVGTYWPHCPLFYRRANERVSGTNDAIKLWKDIFAARTMPAGTRDLVSLDRQSTIDVVRAELNALKPRLARDDQHKLDAHLEHIRTLERRLPQHRAQLLAPTCAPGDTPVPGMGLPGASRLMWQVVTLALKCDAARVLGFTFTGPGGGGNIVYDWTTAAGRHHDLSHGSRPKPGEQTYESLTAIGRWHAEQMAAFLTMLDAVPEDGRTMLDNSLVLWATEHSGNKVGADDHGRRDVPYMLFGSGGGAIKTGQVLDCKGRAHNDLLLSLVHAMGFRNETSFGAANVCKGPLPGLT